MEAVTTAPTATLDLSGIDATERYDLWRESISVIFESGLKPEDNPQSFNVQQTTSHLSSMLLSTTHSQGQYFNRPKRLIAMDGLDHCLLQVYTRGTTTGQWGKRNSTVQPGDVFLLDLSQPVSSLTTDFSVITLVVPRPVLEQHLPNLPKYHGCVLPGSSAFGKLLGEHLKTLQSVTPTLSAHEAIKIAEGVTHLAGSYFSGAGINETDFPEANPTMLASVRQYISKNLNNPDLSPDSIATHFNMSRAYLYRLFSHEQGVSHYIQEQRLQRAYRELNLASNQQKRIGEIAFGLGFSSESHFSRSFQRQFGITPTEVRANAWERMQSQNAPANPVDRRYEDWVRQL